MKGVKKTCSVCGTTRPLEEFTKDKRKRDGRSTRCKPCHRELSNEWRARNPTYLREWYLAHRPEPSRVIGEVVDGQKRCFTCGTMKSLDQYFVKRQGIGGRASHCKACRRQARLDNIEVARERERQTRARNPTYMKEWRAKNPGKVAAAHFRRQRRIGDTTFGFSLEYIEAVIMELREQSCEYCGGPGGEVDHVVPIARGGLHHPQNFAACCRACNASKGSRLLQEWQPLRAA